MKERLEALLKKLTERRGKLLDGYLSDLNADEWDNTHSMNAVNSAGLLHDIDRHITNLTVELNRISPMQGEGPHAS